MKTINSLIVGAGTLLAVPLIAAIVNVTAAADDQTPTGDLDVSEPRRVVGSSTKARGEIPMSRGTWQ